MVRTSGHEATDVRDLSLRNREDATLAAYARQHVLAILSRDFDFADVRNYPPADYAGIAVVDLPNESHASLVLKVITRFVQNDAWIARLPGKLAIISAARVRFRPA